MIPGFFTEVDSLGIVENHIQEVLKLEGDQARQVLKEYSEIRKDLVDRLSRTGKGTFSSQHLRGTLAQVSGAITALQKHLNGASIQSSYQLALKGVTHLTKELQVFDRKFTGAVTPINLNAALVAHDTSQLLIAKYKANTDKYGADLYSQVANGLFSASLGETSYYDVVGRVSNFFVGKEWELHRIMRTELHGVYNRAKIDGMIKLQDDLPDLKKTLMHPMDERTGMDSKLAASLQLVADIDQPFVYTWEGKQRVFMNPPDRPNDRAVMIPYRETWADAKGSAFVPGSFPQA